MKNFDKYRTRGADYHYHQIDKSSFASYNAAVEARFLKLVENIGQNITDSQKRVLDVGCGDGVALYLLHKKFPNLELYGIDPAVEAVKIAKKKIPKAHITQGEAGVLPYEDNFFDLVISSDVIEHVPDPSRMLSEISRVAKVEATIIIGTPIRHSKTPLDHNHIQEWFAEDFENLLKSRFNEIRLHESHSLVPTLLYSQPPHSVLNFKTLINLLSLIFGWNPFLAERKNKMQMFAYMYAVCKK